MYNPHEILGVEEGDDMSVIRQRYKMVSKMFHPDKHRNDKSAIAVFQLVKSCYDSLKESKKKIVLPIIDSIDAQPTKPDETISHEKSSVISGTNITENDIRILGERLNDPWFHPEFDLTDLFGDVKIPEKKGKK